MEHNVSTVKAAISESVM